MKATEFVKLMQEETQGNTDITAATWHLMRQIADHYDQCRDCRQSFDEMEYDDETLLEIAERLEQDNDLADWICCGVKK